MAYRAQEMGWPWSQPEFVMDDQMMNMVRDLYAQGETPEAICARISDWRLGSIYGGQLYIFLQLLESPAMAAKERILQAASEAGTSKGGGQNSQPSPQQKTQPSPQKKSQPQPQQKSQLPSQQKLQQPPQQKSQPPRQQFTPIEKDASLVTTPLPGYIDNYLGDATFRKEYGGSKANYNYDREESEESEESESGENRDGLEAAALLHTLLQAVTQQRMDRTLNSVLDSVEREFGISHNSGSEEEESDWSDGLSDCSADSATKKLARDQMKQTLKSFSDQFASQFGLGGAGNHGEYDDDDDGWTDDDDDNMKH
ncbi:hypothetical protein BGZ73_002790 [Actinomortierella ambigua]|nr:hypothetical protein BGZ73_002790 [Actinomortierella ambigua]